MTSVFEEECKNKSPRRPPVAVFAVGKYGTRELTFDADLDVLFIGDRTGRKRSDKFEKVATGMIQILSNVSSRGRLYDVDARLRPEGRSAPLVVDKQAYEVYLKERASLWERQSLTRMRFVCGDAVLAEDVARTVASFVYETPLPSGWADQIVAMRRKVETRSRTHAPELHDVKLGPGGMVDIEFIAQMIQMKFGGQIPSMRFMPTTDVLEAVPSSVLTGEQADFLKLTYESYRRIELMMRLALEERSTLLPAGDSLELLARILGVLGGEELHNQVTANMRAVRSHFLQIARILASN